MKKIKIIRTANIGILKVWLTGGQTDFMGDYAEGINTFSEYKNDLLTEGKLDYKKVSNVIDILIMEYGNDKFEYYGDTYKFKFPNKKNMKRLVDRVFEKVQHDLDFNN